MNVAPDLDSATGATTLRQGYLAIDGDVEVRLRDADGTTSMTIKAGHGLDRSEIELPLDPDDAAVLWEHAAERSVHKVRHRLPLGHGLVAELDVYEGTLTGLRVVEVEFEDVEAAREFEPPEWFGRELTGEPGWSNAELAERGMPS